MKDLKDGIRSLVRIDFHGHVHKQFRGTDADKRFANEIAVLQILEERGCPNVPRLLEAQQKSLSIITTNCGSSVEFLTQEKAQALFRELEEIYGIRHNDPEPQNVTYSTKLGRFCLIDFELAEILPEPEGGLSRGETWRSNWIALTQQGHKHLINDDSLLILSVTQDGARRLDNVGEDLLSPSHLVLAVSDGMGGRSGGDFASKLILNFIKKDATELYNVISSGSGGKRALELLTKSTHEGLLTLAQNDANLNGCGATLTLAWILPGLLYWVHVGDSRLYLKDGNKVEQLTQDDCRLWHSFKQGELTEYLYRTDPRRSRLADALGGGPHKIRPQTGCIEIKPGSRILLCTDGIMDGLWDRQIEERLAACDSVRGIAEEMLERSCENDPNDDTTLIVAEFEVV